MRIAVLGSGNIGTLISAQFKLKGHEVRLYSRKPHMFGEYVICEDTDCDTKQSVKGIFVSDDLKRVVSNVELVVVTVPSFAIRDLMERVFPLIDTQTRILFYPGTGGVEFYCKEFVEAGGVIFGTQRVCSVARLKEYGHHVVSSGKREEMFVASIPSAYKFEAVGLIENLFDIKTNALPNYLSVTFTPSNPILHTSRLYSLFKEYDPESGYDYIPLFYEEWNLDSSNVLVSLDGEVQEMCHLLPMDLKDVRSLLIHYESKDALQLKNKICSIKSFKGLKTPQIEKNERFHPDLESRYFTADFPYGLLILKAFANICKLDTPMMDEVIGWYQRLIGKEYLTEEMFLGKDSMDITLPQHYGINGIEDVISYYE